MLSQGSGTSLSRQHQIGVSTGAVSLITTRMLAATRP